MYYMKFYFMIPFYEAKYTAFALRLASLPTQVSAPPCHSQPCADRNLLVCTRFSAVKTSRKRNSFLMVHARNDSPLYYCLNLWQIFSTLPQHYLKKTIFIFMQFYTFVFLSHKL